MTPSTLEMVLRPQNLSILFQPMIAVVDSGCCYYAFEGLTRGPRGTNMEKAPVLFEYARRKGQESVLDASCVERIFQEAERLPSGSTISVNVHASTLSRDDGFVVLLQQVAERHRWPLDRVIVEVIEHGGPWSTDTFHYELDALRALGVRIALDDVGIGDSNIKMLVDCRPDLLKIDRYFTHGCSTDRYRRAVIGALVQLGEGCGAEVLGEGVELPADLDVLLALGVRLFQGYAFSEPGTADQFHASAALFDARILPESLVTTGNA
jgi:EAL domain-containing protein (putative c-di-GMP-specific phosphodiesterase class I)